MRPDRQRSGGGFEPDHARAPGESRPEGGQRQQVSRFHVPLLLPDGDEDLWGPEYLELVALA